MGSVSGTPRRICRGNGATLLALSWRSSPKSQHNSRSVTSRYGDPPACAVMFGDICQHVERGSVLCHVGLGYRCQWEARLLAERKE
ncbi:ATP synthase subunit a [Clarias magur]|uniref:ATP synthase subunit a n=1 Tax=Clarias magur TaxID=1594786 RepID=A0A8J4X630_CLAMG|nr:ATP synthase subunit a [Clarias magur]